MNAMRNVATFSTECLRKYWKKSSFMHQPSPIMHFLAILVALFIILLLPSHVSIPSEKKQWDSSPDIMSRMILFSSRISVSQGKSM